MYFELAACFNLLSELSLENSFQITFSSSSLKEAFCKSFWMCVFMAFFGILWHEHIYFTCIHPSVLSGFSDPNGSFYVLARLGLGVTLRHPWPATHLWPFHPRAQGLPKVDQEPCMWGKQLADSYHVCRVNFSWLCSFKEFYKKAISKESFHLSETQSPCLYIRPDFGWSFCIKQSCEEARSPSKVSRLLSSWGKVSALASCV